MRKLKFKNILKEGVVDHYTVMYMLESLGKYIKEI